MSLHYGNPYEPNNFQSDRFFSIIQMCGEFLPSKAPDFNCVFFSTAHRGKPSHQPPSDPDMRKNPTTKILKGILKTQFLPGMPRQNSPLLHEIMRWYDALFLRKCLQGTNFRVFSFFSFFVFSTPLGSTAYLPNAPGLMFGDDGPACVAPWLVGHPAGKFPPTCLNYP